MEQLEVPVRQIHLQERALSVRKILALVCCVMVLLAIAAGSILAVAYRASQKVPDFYQHALQQQPAEQNQAGEQLEREMLRLHNEARRGGRWEAVFSDQQINGWLAADLPEKFPTVLPRGVQDPRVAINPDEAQIACRYESPKVSTVVSLALEIQLTDEPNVVAVRIRNARAGMLPLPLKNFLDRITHVASTANIPLRWMQVDGDPVALVTVPAQHEGYRHREIYLEHIELRDGEIYLAGHTERALNTLASRMRPTRHVEETQDTKQR